MTRIPPAKVTTERSTERTTHDPDRNGRTPAHRRRRRDRPRVLGVHLLSAPIAETVFEPRVGGHIVDRAVDGTECRWARILVYEPPVRVVFSWDISPQWSIVTDPDMASEVEVRFHAETPQRTRVDWSTDTSNAMGSTGEPSPAP